MKCHACDTEEMETQKRGLKHLIYTTPLTYGLKTVDSCSAAVHWLGVYCEEQSNWEQNTEAAIACFIPIPFLMQLEENVALLLVEPTVWKSYSVVVYGCL